MLPQINGTMTLKEITDLHSNLFKMLQHFGLDLNVGKMTTLEDACKKKGVKFSEVLEALNFEVQKINQKTAKIDSALEKEEKKNH